MDAHHDRSVTDDPIVRLDGVRKTYGAIEALREVSLELRRGELFALLGASGCGKTTLLRLIAGFERPDRGRVLIDGVDVTALPPHKRPVNTVFQSYALFPHMSVARNIAFGLERQGIARADIDARVGEMLALVRLEAERDRRPAALSGGQRQRVALARALARHPRVLLLDEPLAALDRKLREDTRFDLVRLRERLGITFLFVTHDQDEALAIAHRVGVMERGAIAQIGPPREVYERVISRFVADFIGGVNLFAGRVVGREGGHVVVRLAGGAVRVAHDAALPDGSDVCVAVRPERLSLAPSGDANRHEGRIGAIAYRGEASMVHLVLSCGTPARMTIAGAQAAPASGENLAVYWRPRDGVVLTR